MFEVCWRLHTKWWHSHPEFDPHNWPNFLKFFKYILLDLTIRCNIHFPCLVICPIFFYPYLQTIMVKYVLQEAKNNYIITFFSCKVRVFNLIIAVVTYLGQLAPGIGILRLIKVSHHGWSLRSKMILSLEKLWIDYIWLEIFII